MVLIFARKYFTFIILTAFLFAFNEAKASDKIKEKAQTVKTAAGDLVSTTRDEVKKELNDKIAALDKEVERLKTELKSLGTSAANKASDTKEAQLAALEKKRNALKAKVDDIQNTSEKAWSHVRTGLQSAWKDLSVSFTKAQAEIEGAAANK